MASQKLYKITKIVKEMNASSDGRYNIDGINMSLAKFLWRSPQMQFEDLNPSDYRIDTVGGSTFLVITSAEVNSSLESVQVAYILDFTSSRYETEYDVDVNTLKNKFNLLVDDTLNMWEHLRKTGMISDVSGFSIILPELEKDEVWVKTENGFRGFSIGNLEANIQDLIDQFKQLADSYLAELKRIGDKYLDDLQNLGELYTTKITTEGNTQADRVLNIGNTQNDRVINQGDFQTDRINSATDGIDSRLQMIWRMYSILTGSQRYLSGGVITQRDPVQVEKEVVGGLVSARDGEARRHYNGGLVSDRTVKVPTILDLGEY